MFLVAFLFAGLTAGVNQALIGRIALNEETRNTKYLLDVLGIDYPKTPDPAIVNSIEEERTAKQVIDGMTVYRAYDKEGRPADYAFPIAGKGFWGNISGLLALDKDLDTIEGIVFTEHQETPGLGARIEEKWFRDQFKGIKLPEKGTGKPYIRIAPRDGDQQNRVDAITGATMTSTALERILNVDIKRILSKKEEIRRAEWPSQPKR